MCQAAQERVAILEHVLHKTQDSVEDTKHLFRSEI